MMMYKITMKYSGMLGINPEGETVNFKIVGYTESEAVAEHYASKPDCISVEQEEE